MTDDSAHTHTTTQTQVNTLCYLCHVFIHAGGDGSLGGEEMYPRLCELGLGLIIVP